MKNSSYRDELAGEWIDWVESVKDTGSRALEIFPRIRKWIEECRPKNLVDIGCGQGIGSTLIADSIEYFGVDGSSALISRAKKLYKSKHVSFKVGDVYSMPFEDSLFDAAMSIWVWSHLADLPGAAEEMARILRIGGSFMIVTANPETYELRKTFYTSHTISGNLLTGTFDLGAGKRLTNTTLYLHTRNEMAEALRQAGFTIENTEAFGLDREYPGGLNIAFYGKRLD